MQLVAVCWPVSFSSNDSRIPPKIFFIIITAICFWDNMHLLILQEQLYPKMKQYFGATEE